MLRGRTCTGCNLMISATTGSWVTSGLTPVASQMRSHSLLCCPLSGPRISGDVQYPRAPVVLLMLSIVKFSTICSPFLAASCSCSQVALLIEAGVTALLAILRRSCTQGRNRKNPLANMVARVRGYSKLVPNSFQPQASSYADTANQR